MALINPTFEIAFFALIGTSYRDADGIAFKKRFEFKWL